MVQWQAPYAAGALRAIGYRDGKLVAERLLETTGPPVALRLMAEGGARDPVAIAAVDSAGRIVPTASDRVELSISGPAKILGVGSGDSTCHEPDKATGRSLFRGLAQIIIQPSGEAGAIRLTAASGSLASATVTFAVSQAWPAAIPPARPNRLISSWRMSPITRNRPDPNQAIADADMNSWERIDPARGPQTAWTSAGGFAIYRATFPLPKFVQSTGARLIFREIRGQAEAFVNGAACALTAEQPAGSFSLALPPSLSPVTVSILVKADGAPAGICNSIELSDATMR
jgi:beta-galactosidase